MSRFTVVALILDILEIKTYTKELSDIGLLELLCSQYEDELLYTQFINRFLPDMILECNKICKSRKLDRHIGIQIAHETFERVKKYKSFKSDKIKLPDDRRAILVYLLKISTRLFNDHYRKEKSKEENHRNYFDDICDSNELKTDVKELKNKKDISCLIWGNLSDKEKRVVLVDMEFKRHQKYLPDDVTESLAKELNVKKDTVRRLRKRAIEKINKTINEINQ